MEEDKRFEETTESVELDIPQPEEEQPLEENQGMPTIEPGQLASVMRMHLKGPDGVEFELLAQSNLANDCLVLFNELERKLESRIKSRPEEGKNPFAK